MLLSAVLLGSVVCPAPCCAVLAAGVSVCSRVLAARVVDRLCRSWNSCPVSTGELWVLLAVSVLTKLSWCRPSGELTHGRSVDLSTGELCVLLAVSVLTELPCGRSVARCVVLKTTRPG